ncbi:MAG TPA: tetraacyldisaccharide 4'-kinase [Methylomirabilota bacterium]|nr:tetraacyldisaccharide 4'-kinase [Methylomirabilota bacterium]
MTTPRRAPEVLLRRYWEDPDTPVVTAGLSALSVGYRTALSVRDWAYRCRILRTGRLPCAVVSVGNITLGGSGKTPTVELAVRTLQEHGAAPAVVSRGYGRATRGVCVVADREGVRADARTAGDEPLLLALHLPGVPVVVGESRYEAGRVAVERYGATALVLDDGFQHRTLAKNLEVLVVQGRAPWGNARVFPRGMLREPLSALARAHAVVVTNPPAPEQLQAVAATVERYNPGAAVLAASYQVQDAHETRSGRRLPVGELVGRRLIAFAGLGSPQGFADTLDAAGIRRVGFVEFPDHHWFTPRDLNELERDARAAGAQGLITTEKDWMRLKDLPPPALPLWVLPVRLALGSGLDIWQRLLAGVLTPTALGHPCR